MSFTAYLIFDDEPDVLIELMRARNWLGQSIDDKGMPNGRVRGGLFTFVVRGNSTKVFQWVTSNTMQKSGRIRFLRHDQPSVEDDWVFENAYGVAMHCKFHSSSGRRMLVGVSAERLTVLGITHDNKWPK